MTATVRSGAFTSTAASPRRRWRLVLRAAHRREFACRDPCADTDEDRYGGQLMEPEFRHASA